MLIRSLQLRRALAKIRHVFARNERHVIWITLATPAVGTALAVTFLVNGIIQPTTVEITVAVTLYLLTGLGITIGFHRLFAHRAFTAPTGVRLMLGILGSMSAQGSLLFWVATHRRHHAATDRAGDPHSPYFADGIAIGRWWGLLHAHLGWMLKVSSASGWNRIPDLLNDRIVLFVNRWYFAWVGLGLALPVIISGLWYGTFEAMVSGLLWGGLVRIFVSQQATWSINSLAHVAGIRRFVTQDQSRNNALVALISLGEGWHNNHHAAPMSARFGHAWWEIDPGWLTIRMLSRFGLVSDVKSNRQDWCTRVGRHDQAASA
ncbi:acyl-CoA desaturase [Burkholderia sp. MS455]|uniref:acyl-CoA desaturase n=1 Tax=Burkholderia sp. MS455 TaxID=2811788 RepID=UPI00195E99FF|nr:acyl-CoA desaturase [Burkholderia sp. MS455]QRR07608.1 acyl-CoA desaturase [Burkholderia sp. MS455]